MNNLLKKLTLTVTSAWLASLLYSGHSLAKANESAVVTSDHVAQVKAAAKHHLLQDKVKPADADAVAVIGNIQQAILALGKNDGKTAKSHLQTADRVLASILAKNPGLALLPADVNIDLEDFSGTSEEVAAITGKARDYLKQDKLQAARQLLADLASDATIETVNIPLATFPAAIKQAITTIDAGLLDQAAVDLDASMNTLVVEGEVFVLPVLRAEDLLTEASVLEHQTDLSQEQNRAKIRTFTDAAKEQIRLAERLGYGSKTDYEPLFSDIDAIDKVLFTEKSKATWAKIKSHIDDLKRVITNIGHPAQ
jgi:hypothetical protein